MYQRIDNFFKFQHTSILESKAAKNQLATGHTFLSIKSALNVQIYDNP